MTDDTRKRRKYAELAVQLHQISDRPEHQDRKWSWEMIGYVLGINATTAQRLVQWMRKNYTEQYWTVGIWASDYRMIPTKQARDALDGLLNQQRHLLTRISTLKQGCETLARIDPNAHWQRLMELNANHFADMLSMERGFQERLLQRADELNWHPMEREEV